MCDDITEVENAVFLERVRLNRREVGVGAGVVVASVLTGCASQRTQTKETKEGAMNEASALETTSRMVTIETPDGAAEGFFVTPKSGRHPGVLMWPDVAGLRDAYETMATRLATSGYAVLAVNPYYRSSKLPVLEAFSEWRTEEGRAKIAPMREMLTPEAVTQDGTAFVEWLDQQKEVDDQKKIASAGYCMSGSFTFRTAAAVPERVGAIASFHGGGLVTDEPTSPHTLFSKMKAAALICIAQNDDERQPEAKTELAKAAEAAGTPAEIEVYPAQHGWCTIDSPVYDETQAERAWARMLATFERYL